MTTGKKILFYLLFSTSLCALAVGSTSARYRTEMSSRDSARTARFAISTTLSQSRLVLKEDRKIIFTVSNGEAVSEVALEYDVIATLPAEPEFQEGFGMDLFCNGEKRDGTAERTDGAVVYTFPGAGSFEAGVRAIDTCELVLLGPTLERSGTFRLDIDVIARQLP